MPDSVAYVCAISTTKHEFFFMEVKTTDQACNKFQRDLIKLGKAMQIALDKLILIGVDSPEVVGLLVEGTYLLLLLIANLRSFV